MKLPPFAYDAPEDLEEACALLHELGEEAKVLAGGQSLFPMMALRLARPAHVIDIGRVRGLDSVEAAADRIGVGATCTHAMLERDQVVRRDVPILHRAAPLIAHAAIRSRGTVGGSLAHNDPAAELPAVALLHDAEIRIDSVRGPRFVPASVFLESYLTTALEADEVVTRIMFPVTTAPCGVSIREVARRHGDFALVGAAARAVDVDGSALTARVALFGVGSCAVAFDLDAASLDDRLLDPARARATAGEIAAGLDPPSDVHASAAYRRHLAGVLIERVLLEAGAELQEAMG